MLNKKRGFQKRNGPPPLKHVFAATFIFFLISTFLSLWIINKGIEPTLMEIAETRTKQFAREAINEAVSKRIAEDLQTEQLVKIEKDAQGNVVQMDWNTVVVNRVLRNTTYRVQNYLKMLEKGDVPKAGTPLDVEVDPDEPLEEDDIEENPALIRIPVGQATNNTLLANLGPKVPVHFQFIGDVQSNVQKEITEYGINGAFFNISIHIVANVRVVIPFSTRTATVETDIPVYFGTVQGEVPNFYNGIGGEQQNPTFSIPINEFSPLPK